MLVVFATGIHILSGCAGRYVEVEHNNPVASLGFADPTVVRDDDGTWWAYATNNGGYAVPMLRSDNLLDWRLAGSALERKPGWHPGTFQAQLWAPHVARIGDTYLLYYSLAIWGQETGEFAPGIGVATSSTPRGPFTDAGKLFLSDEIGVRNSIDPYLFLEDGSAYLFWGSWGGIWGVELTSDGLSLMPGAEPFQIGGSAYEAAWIERVDDTYWFFGSIGSCCEGARSTYSVVAARADSLRGPYTGKSGRTLMANGATQILRGDSSVAGPGHIALTQDDSGDYWMLYHAWSSSNSYANRQLFLDRLRFDGDCWPYVNDGHPSYQKATAVR